MAVARNPLRRLGERAGIATGYRDIWGRDHETSDETRIALLQAMGVIREPAGVAAALREREERDWLTGLPPVSVRRWGERPYQWEVCCDGPAAGRAVQWTLALESGETLRGATRLSELRTIARRGSGVTRRIKALFQWRQPLPLGYHRFRLDLPYAGERSCMALIIVPARCYAPPELQRGARRWGPALQLYAIRSDRNWGIGDFTDLRNAVSCLARAGAGIVGLSPLHALFPHDPGHSSPYSPSSRNHLNPLYIDVEAIPEFAGCRAARDLVAAPRFQAQLRALRGAEFVDYPAVTEAKLGVLRAIYRSFRERQRHAGAPRAVAFSRYLADGGEGLLKFVLHQALQEAYSRDAGRRGWPAWPAAFRDSAAPAVLAYLDAHRERVEFHAWLQWIADDQLAACGQRCRDLNLGVGLYRDLAVSIDRAGAEAWAWRDLYATAASIGAPPDEFNLYGQDWALPPLIPERLARAGYAPFTATLSANMRHAGALRVDHVMGLARLFWVPPGGTPAQGAYVRYPVQDLLGILALESGRNCCMVIGEDLGTQPEGFAGQLQAAGIFSYRLLMFEKEEGGKLRPPAAYPGHAVAAAGTHDLPTLKGYWRGHDLEVRARLQLFPSDAERVRQVADRARDRKRLLLALKREGLLPPGMQMHPAATPDMTPELVLAIHAYLARSHARLMVVQMEDLFGQLDQVNLPATGDQYPNWQRRLSPRLEDWAGDARMQALAAMLRGMRARDRRDRAADSADPGGMLEGADNRRQRPQDGELFHRQGTKKGKQNNVVGRVPRPRHRRGTTPS